MRVSGWETGLEMIRRIQNSGGLLQQIPPPFAPCCWSRGGEEPDHNKNCFHHLLFGFSINRFWHRWSGRHFAGVLLEVLEVSFFCFLPSVFPPVGSIQTPYRLMLLSHLINPAFHLLGDVLGGRERVRSLERPPLTKSTADKGQN